MSPANTQINQNTKPNIEEPFWLKGTYDNQAAQTLSRLPSSLNLIEQSVEKFFLSLSNMSAAADVLSNLTEIELGKLTIGLTSYIETILSPELSLAQHRSMALEAGTRHVYVGLTVELLAEASSLYRDILTALLKGTHHAEQLQAVITRRFQYDLITQIQAFGLVQRQRLELYEHIAQTEHMANPLDFVQDSLKSIHDAFHNEILGIAYGRVRNGNFRYLLTKGEMPFTKTGESLPDYESIVIPEINDVWFNEQPLLINNLNSNDMLSTELKRQCTSRGIRSLGILLARDLQGAPKACILVSSRFPGYFSDNNSIHFWQQLADLMGTDLDFIERTNMRRHRLADGLRFRQLLSQQKVEMYYQPIVEPSSGKTIKIEALARLKEGDDIIAPGIFLPAFGANQLRELFDLGLDRIMSDLSDLYPQCSINIPPEVMNDKNWFSTLSKQLEHMGAHPNRISLEILETALSDDNNIQQSLYGIKEAGYDILLDDVGAGESSLLRLATLPITGIKIDQSFVRSLQHSFEYLDFIISLRSLAVQRSLVCIAEGVETPGLVDMLGSVSGMLLQGYAFAKPMTATALAEWMNRKDEAQPLGPFPQSLYGWYGRHVDRFTSVRNALSSSPDLLSSDYLLDAERCPLHGLIPHIGGDADIEAAHREWHHNYARFTTMIQKGVSIEELWQTMEASKQELRRLIEYKVNIRQIK